MVGFTAIGVGFGVAVTLGVTVAGLVAVGNATVREFVGVVHAARNSKPPSNIARVMND